MMRRWSLVLGVVLLAGCGGASKRAADSVYFGGDILTMAGDSASYVEALAVKDGRILTTGTKADVMKLVGKGTRQVDLAGRTLLPGFIDAHSHILNVADGLVQANLNPPPVGKVERIADIVTQMQALKASLGASDTTVLIGQGYDQSFLAEKRHPTAADLDAAFPTNPVILLHVSGHMLVANSAALRLGGITAATKDPEGGTIIRKHGSREPEGLLQETGMYFLKDAIKAPRAIEVDLDLLKRALAQYTENGYTTAQEGMLFEEKRPLLERAAKDSVLTIDVVALPSYVHAKELVGTGALPWGTYSNHLKYAGIKLALDGSPQGKTAYLTSPYLTPVPGCTHDCRGFPTMGQADVNALFTLCYRNHVQLYSHCNGDAAIDMMIAAHQAAEKALGGAHADRRTVIIHSQVIRPDQVQAYRTFGLVPSYFSNHTYYWGDEHLANLGPERAAFISPLKSTLALGVRATNHTDASVTPLDPMFLLWTSVNRLTRTGKVLGPDERVSPYQGLLALTSNGAYEYFEEKTKGTLEAGKLADLVVLDRNPLKVDPMAIKDIRIMATVKEGHDVYTRPEGR